MPRKRELQFVFRNTAAVVRDGDFFDAPLPQAHLNTVRSGIHRVFDQFLHDGCRPVDHFARSNLTDQLIRQRMNRTTQREFV